MLRFEKQDGEKRAASCHLLSILEQDFGPCWHFDLLRWEWKVYCFYPNKGRCKRFDFIWQDQAGHWSHAWRHRLKLTWSHHEKIQRGQVQSTLRNWCRFKRSGHSKRRLGNLNRTTQGGRDLHPQIWANSSCRSLRHLHYVLYEQDQASHRGNRTPSWN